MTNPIGWCDITLNIVTGCLNSCPFCYARKFARRLAGRYGYPKDDPFKPTFHPDKLQELYNLPKAPKRIFLDSMGDWFSEGVDPAWLHEIIAALWESPQHLFFVLTKRPERIQEMLHCIDLPPNLWFGVSVCRQEDTHRLLDLRAALPWTTHKFVSFEPLQERITVDLQGLDWVIVGAETGNRKGKIEPLPFWVESLLVGTPRSLPVFMKDNLMCYIEEIYPQLMEFPPFPEAI